MKLTTLLAAAFLSTCSMSVFSQPATLSRDEIAHIVDETIPPLMAHDGIAGMAVGVVVEGKPYVFDYGVASKESGTPVTRNTLFELGSISKTFTATLASYAEKTGHLSLSDPVGKYLPELRGSAFGDEVTLLNLGTHTPGGLPLQVPDEVHDNAQLMQYFKGWQPRHAPGTYRTYANPGIGTLGLITAKSMGQDFDTLIQQRIFAKLGMSRSYMQVPADRMGDYAEGYTKDGTPIRMKPGVLASEAYGVRSTAGDMTRFLLANMNDAAPADAMPVDATLQRAIMATHTAYFQAGPMTQDLIWEQYPYPAPLSALLDGNGPAMIVDGHPVERIDPPQGPRDDVWLNKTGSTNGFGAYIAFVPSKHVGIVMLGNKNIPNADRVRAAYAIMTSLINGKTQP
ncbi:beta-lactamase [Caballeronia sp. LZ062]|uniref:class C beta-lactamase n=1 Tax=unclassified Caballeronia TaxID=2646786 RepID=UPI00285EE64E|nr:MULTISPECIES: class C beta-lactamase [unclassified Caballeronia]MDR5856115.1 beta-lactamase [Caballeronia sp. LZ050]MDR5872786.1 beta-lactamase [Caballeronia sp. LZ062]